MKILSALALGVCISLSVCAQPINQHTWKTTGVKQRLLAVSSYESPATYYDSVYYRYSNDRGSAYNFDSGFRDRFYGDYTNTLNVQYDSAVRLVLDVPTSALQLSSVSTINYSPEQFIADYKNYNYHLGSFTGADRYINYYSAPGVKSSSAGFSYVASNWDSNAHDKYTYDSQNRLVSDSNFVRNGSAWDLSFTIQYSYLPNGLLGTSSRWQEFSQNWQHIYEDTLDYYPNGKLRTSIYQYFGTPIHQKDSLIYDASNTFVQSTIMYRLNGSSWYKWGFLNKHINAAGLPDTLYHGNYASITSLDDTTDKSWYTYNSYNSPVHQHSEFYYPTLHTGDVWYYYELYNVRVTDEKKISDLILYPNPTSNIVTITSTQLLNKKLNIQLYNTLGQLLKNERLVWTNSGYQLSLGNYGEGTYWVVMKDEMGIVLCSKSVLKQ